MGTTSLIVDDHPEVRALVRWIAAQEPDLHVVGEAADGAEAIQLTRTLRPDIVVMDLMLPRLNGLEAMRQIKAARPETKVIIVTMHSEDAYHRAAADDGADAFLLKKTLMTTLVPTLHRLCSPPSPPNTP